MKKRVTIELEIDTEAKGASGAGLVPPYLSNIWDSLDRPKPDERYTIRVAGPLTPAGKSVDVAAHELGHVLSGIFELPFGVKSDPRTPDAKGVAEVGRGDGLDISKDAAGRIWESEALAWKLAKGIWPQLSQREMEYSLESYLPYLYHSMGQTKRATQVAREYDEQRPDQS